MFGSLKKALTAVKEGALETGAKSYINQKIQKFGAVTKLQIDSTRKAVEIEVMLKGEPTPIQVRANSYELSGDAEKASITLREFEASREWLASVLNEYLAGRPFKIPVSLRNLL